VMQASRFEGLLFDPFSLL
jgi:hypothetical protein